MNMNSTKSNLSSLELIIIKGQRSRNAQIKESKESFLCYRVKKTALFFEVNVDLKENKLKAL